MWHRCPDYLEGELPIALAGLGDIAAANKSDSPIKDYSLHVHRARAASRAKDRHAGEAFRQANRGPFF